MVYMDKGVQSLCILQYVTPTLWCSSSLLVSLITAVMDKIDQWLLGTIGWCIHMIGDCDYCWSCYLQQVIGRWDQCIGSTASKQFIGQLIPVGQRSWWSTRINASNHYGYRGARRYRDVSLVKQSRTDVQYTIVTL